MQELEVANVDQVNIEYRSKFHITIPRSLPEDERGASVRRTLAMALASRRTNDVYYRSQRPLGLCTAQHSSGFSLL